MDIIEKLMWFFFLAALVIGFSIHDPQPQPGTLAPIFRPAFDSKEPPTLFDASIQRVR